MQFKEPASGTYSIIDPHKSHTLAVAARGTQKRYEAQELAYTALHTVWHFAHFSLIIMFLWLSDGKIEIRIKIRLIVQPYAMVEQSNW